jgi:nucleotide-binding universal stress UspA family protein
VRTYSKQIFTIGSATATQTTGACCYAGTEYERVLLHNHVSGDSGDRLFDCCGGKAMMRQTILVPLDGSSFSQQIVPHIQHLFDPQIYALMLLRVAEMPIGITSAPPLPVSGSFPLPSYVTALDFERARHPIYAEQQEQNVRSALEGELEPTAGTLRSAGYQVTVMVRFGDAAEEIAQFAKTEQIDLIAMATHGRTGIRQFVLGSVAEQVLWLTEVPVLLVRPCDVSHIAILHDS